MKKYLRTMTLKACTHFLKMKSYGLLGTFENMSAYKHARKMHRFI